MCSCYYHYWHDIQFSAKLQVCNVWCISHVTFPHKCMIDVSGQNMWYNAKTLGEFEVREFKINHFMKLLISPLNFSTFGLLFEFCSAKGQKISKKKYVVLDSSKIRMLGQFYALKIAPAHSLFFLHIWCNFSFLPLKSNSLLGVPYWKEKVLQHQEKCSRK